jgi:hypothetical protein
MPVRSAGRQASGKVCAADTNMRTIDADAARLMRPSTHERHGKC